MNTANHKRTNRRTNRCISASGSEWRAVSDMAGAAGMSISRFVLQRVLTPPVTEASIEQTPLPDAARQEQLRATLTLMRIAERPDAKARDVDRWPGGRIALRPGCSAGQPPCAIDLLSLAWGRRMDYTLTQRHAR